MRSIVTILSGGLALGAALFIGAANAAEISFDGARGVAVPAGLPQVADIKVPPAVTALSGARVYDFKTLYAGLGYPSPGYFGASEDSLFSLESYISKEDTYYGEINGYLRYYPAPYEWYGTGPDDARVMVSQIDEIFERAPRLPEDLIMFRGLGLGWHGNKPFTIGEEFTDKGYVSTSVSYSVARYFAIEKDPDEDAPSRRAVFTLYFTRPGEKGILIDQDEEEVMLQHGRRFRVMGRKDWVEKYDLYLVQVCADACETTLRPGVGAFWTDFTVAD